MITNATKVKHKIKPALVVLSLFFVYSLHAHIPISNSSQIRISGGAKLVVIDSLKDDLIPLSSQKAKLIVTKGTLIVNSELIKNAEIIEKPQSLLEKEVKTDEKIIQQPKPKAKSEERQNKIKIPKPVFYFNAFPSSSSLLAVDYHKQNFIPVPELNFILLKFFLENHSHKFYLKEIAVKNRIRLDSQIYIKSLCARPPPYRFYT